MKVRKVIIILILGISVFSNAQAAQIVIDSAASYGESSMTLVTPREQFQAIDDNFDELYGFWATIDTEAEFKELYNLEPDVDFYATSTLDTMLGDYVTSSSLTTTLGDYVETSDLATATVGTAGELAPTKESGVPGYSYWFEADTTNELTRGFQGPDDLTVNISDKLPNAAGSVGQIPVISSVQTSQTLPDGRTGTLVSYVNTTVVPTDDGYGPGWDGDTTEIPSKDDIYDKIESLSLAAGAPTIQDTDPTVSDTSGLYQNRTDGDMFLVEQNVAVSTWTTTRTPWWPLTVSDPGNGNSITSSGSIDCPGTCSEYAVNNATPALTGVAASGYEFLAWTGDATDTSTTTNPDTITMDSAKTVGATFNLLPTVVSAEMTTATNLQVIFSEALDIGAGGSDTMTPTGSTTGASVTTYSSGDGTATYNYTTTETFVTGETITLAYTQPGNGLEDSDNGDLASFTGQSVTNSITGGASVVDAYFNCATNDNTGAYNTGGTAMTKGSGYPGYTSDFTVQSNTPSSGLYALYRAGGNGYQFQIPTASNVSMSLGSLSFYWSASTIASGAVSVDGDGDSSPYFSVVDTSATSKEFRYMNTQVGGAATIASSVVYWIQLTWDYANTRAGWRVYDVTNTTWIVGSDSTFGETTGLTGSAPADPGSINFGNLNANQNTQYFSQIMMSAGYQDDLWSVRNSTNP